VLKFGQFHRDSGVLSTLPSLHDTPNPGVSLKPELNKLNDRRIRAIATTPAPGLHETSSNFATARKSQKSWKIQKVSATVLHVVKSTSVFITLTVRWAFHKEN